MFTHHGIAVDAWARIEGDCVVKCDVVGDEAQFEIGHRTASLNLVATRAGLKSLMAASADALAAMDRAAG